MSDMPRVGLKVTHTLGSTLYLEYLQNVRELFCMFHKILRIKPNLQIKLKCIVWKAMHGL